MTLFYEDLAVNAVPITDPLSLVEIEDRENKQFLKQFGEDNPRG